MKEDSRTFISPHGTLIVGKDGVKIKRTWSQALQNGRLTPREQDIPFSSLETVKRQRGRNDAEYIQLISRHGAPKVTPLNRKIFRTIKNRPRVMSVNGRDKMTSTGLRNVFMTAKTIVTKATVSHPSMCTPGKITLATQIATKLISKLAIVIYIHYANLRPNRQPRVRP